VPPGSTATATRTGTIVPDVFRIDSATLSDPHPYASVSSTCIDVTLLVNGQLPTLLNGDGDMDGFLDFSLLALFRPLNMPPQPGGALDIGTADCTVPAGAEVCSPDGNLTQSTTYSNQSSGTCLVPVPGTAGMNNSVPYTPPILTPGAPCFSTASVTINFPFGLFTLPLQNVQAGATYVADPASDLIDGLLLGFLSEADADMIVLPPSIPFGLGGQPISKLLPGGTGSCATHTAKDLGPLGQPGWYFYLNFTAHRVTWTGP
jgi:hypothetical protein